MLLILGCSSVRHWSQLASTKKMKSCLSLSSLNPTPTFWLGYFSELNWLNEMVWKTRREKKEWEDRACVLRAQASWFMCSAVYKRIWSVSEPDVFALRYAEVPGKTGWGFISCVLSTLSTVEAFSCCYFFVQNYYLKQFIRFCSLLCSCTACPTHDSWFLCLFSWLLGIFIYSRDWYFFWYCC